MGIHNIISFIGHFRKPSLYYHQITTVSILLIGVHTEHIASAVGMVPQQDRFSRSSTTIFDMDPHMIAVVKRRANVVDQYNRHYCKLARLDARGYLAPGGNRKLQVYLMYATRTHENPSAVWMKFMTAPEVCVRMKEPLLLSSLKPECFVDFDLSSALKLALHDKLTDVLSHLIEAIRETKYEGISSCIVAAVVYNAPDILTDLVKLLLTMYENDDLTEFKNEISTACHFLKREKCAEVLQNYGLISNDAFINELAKIEKLLDIFSMYPERLSDEIRTILVRLPKSIDYINRNVTLGQYSNKTVLKTVGDIGADLNGVDEDGVGDTFITALLYCMQHDLRYRELRAVLEVLIYQNLDVGLNAHVVKRAVIVDAGHYRYDMSAHLIESELSQTYTMDGKEHSPYGHEGKYFALNFAAPLLLECGYPVRNGVLENAVKKKLHPEELKYFRRCLDSPKTLQWSCCMALRRHFKGRAIHRFVEAADLPEMISDLVLFKNVLKSV